MRTVVHFATGITAALVLWANTYGLPAPSPGAYALALVALLVVGGCVFAQNLEFFFSQATEDSRVPDAAAPIGATPAPVRRGERFTVIQGGSTASTTGGRASTVTVGRPSPRPTNAVSVGSASVAAPGCAWRGGA